MGFYYDPQLRILTWPEDLRPRSQSLRLVTNTSKLTSPLSRTTQTQEWPGSRWTLDATFPPLDKREVKRLRAFLAKLRGAQGLFYWLARQDGDEPVSQPMSGEDALMGPDVVTEGTRIYVTLGPGQPLQTLGWDAAEGQLILRRGDYVSYDDYRGFRRLHVVTDDTYALGSGFAIIPVEPPVRVQAPEGGRLHVGNASGVFRLVSDDQCAIRELPDGGAEVQLSAVEAVSPAIYTAGLVEPAPPPAVAPTASLGWHASVTNASGTPRALNEGYGRDQYDQFEYWASAIATPLAGTYTWEIEWSPADAAHAASGPRVVKTFGRSASFRFAAGLTHAGQAFIRAKVNGDYVPGRLVLEVDDGLYARVHWWPDLAF